MGIFREGDNAYEKRCIKEGFSSDKDFSNDAQMIRSAIRSELDAISFYEQMSSKSSNPTVKKVLLDIAREEKVHFGEFEKLLELLDPEFKASEEEGEEEFEDMIGDKND